jgi:hypothetical protein
MEGSYNKVFLSKGNVPSQNYNYFMEILLNTIRYNKKKKIINSNYLNPFIHRISPCLCTQKNMVLGRVGTPKSHEIPTQTRPKSPKPIPEITKTLTQIFQQSENFSQLDQKNPSNANPKIPILVFRTGISWDLGGPTQPKTHVFWAQIYGLLLTLELILSQLNISF